MRFLSGDGDVRVDVGGDGALAP